MYVYTNPVAGHHMFTHCLQVVLQPVDYFTSYTVFMAFKIAYLLSGPPGYLNLYCDEWCLAYMPMV